MSVYIDLTEFLANPITSGIQRVVGQICTHMPGKMAIPIRLHSGRYFALPDALIPAVGRHFSNPGRDGIAEIRRLSTIDRAAAVQLPQTDTVLVPEVFLDPERVAFFCNMPEQEFNRYRFIVYDLLPLTHPQYFPATAFLDDIYGYFRVIRRANDCGFISEYTRDVYYRRLRRSDCRGGAVLSLGSDFFGPRPLRPVLNRPLTFTVIGTIEPRKNHKLILEAFEPLLRQIPGLRLSFVGKMGWTDANFAEKVHALANDKGSGFQFYSAPDDGAIRTHIEQSRATIYLSPAEGYGLPPVESLWCGTPVIASRTIPSLQSVGSAGIHYIEPLDATSLRQAVVAFLDDTYANRKVEEAIQLNLPTWRSFTQDVLNWCKGCEH
jgi:glycosyltransferase involved in cell wall biosynthesis